MQDWEPVILRKKKNVETEKVLRSTKPITTKKVEKNLEDFRHKMVPKNISEAISKKRLELHMTQSQLAQKINERPSVVNDIEKGTVVYNHVHVNKILRALGLTLSSI